MLASDGKQYFKIVADKDSPQTAYQVKNELIASFQELVMGLDESEYSFAIENNLEETSRIFYDHSTITVVLGNGDGIILEGELKTNYCVKERENIETHFFFWEIFQ